MPKFTKLDLIERIISTTDEQVLARVGEILDAGQADFSFSKEHLALLEERRERRRQGKGRGYSLDEAKAMVKAKHK